MLSAIILLVIPLTVCCVAFRISRRHINKCGDEIPGVKSYPFVGSMLTYVKARNANELFAIIFEQGRKYIEHGIGRAWACHLLLVGIFSPKYIEVLANSPYAVEKGPLYPMIFGDFSNAGVFVTNDPVKWKELRKPLTKALTKKNIENGYHAVFVKMNKLFIEHIMGKWCGKEFDIKKEVQNLTMDMFSETVLGVTTNELLEPRFHFLDHVLQFTNTSITLGVTKYMFKAVYGLRRMATRSTINQTKSGARRFLDWVFEERMRKQGLATHKGKEICYTDFLLARQKEKNLSMRTIRRELIDVVFAGSDTTAVTTSSAILLLAMFPDIQEQAYQEQVLIFGNNSMQEPTPEDLASMECLTRIVKETLRFCCPGLILKYATGDIQLDNYTVPRGTVLGILIDVICHDPKYWEKPNTFYPDHFLPEKEAERPTYAHPVFGFGPRTCPGVVYGMNSIKITLSFILRNFRLSTSLKFEDITIVHKIMREFNSFKVKLEKRTS